MRDKKKVAADRSWMTNLPELIDPDREKNPFAEKRSQWTSLSDANIAYTKHSFTPGAFLSSTSQCSESRGTESPLSTIFHSIPRVKTKTSVISQKIAPNRQNQNVRNLICVSWKTNGSNMLLTPNHNRDGVWGKAERCHDQWFHLMFAVFALISKRC